MISKFYLTDYMPDQTQAFSNITLVMDIHLAIARDSLYFKDFQRYLYDNRPPPFINP